ncbi:MATE family efflux transporter [Cellulosilyticum ruminicola]|uniref:MATE family efflux transporter n=1 Tax=Cellulosilyticum ruminicola TaxID=425254 RepID=UPI0006D0C39F|nr:MATE family efflux transporter [Cellulosilyticum ruminicola]
MKDLTKGSPNKLIVQFAIPILIGNLFQLFYSLVDTRIVGSTLGDKALAAVGATSTLNNLIIGFLIGLTNGFAIIVAHRFGAKKYDSMRKAIAGTLKLGILIACILTVLSITFLTIILRWLNMPEELMADGSLYIRVILMGMSAAMLYNVCASILRAIGDTMTPLMFLIVSTVSNVFLDYLFILGFKTGVEGAAYATVISQIGAAILCFLYMWKKYPILHLSKEAFKGEEGLTKELLSSGLSMGLMQSFVSFGTVALQSAINTLGTNTIVAHAGARKVTEIFMLPFSVLGMTMATYCSQNLGAGKPERIKKGLWQALIMAWAWCALVVIASYTIAPILIKGITATKVDEVVETGSLYLRIDTLLYFVPAVISIIRNSLQGIGDRITPIFSSFIELIGKVIIAIWLTPILKYMGIILAEPIVWILMVIPLIIKIFTTPKLKTTEPIEEAISQ